MDERTPLDDLKDLFEFNKLNNINIKSLPLLMKWLNFEPLNIPICLKVNKYFYWTDKQVLLYALHFKIHKQKTFIQYLKKQQIEEDNLKFLKQNIQNYYDWSDKELQENWQVIELLLQDKDYKIKLDKIFGFNENECKILGLEFNKPNIALLQKQQTTSIEGWF